jgi:hypothetical protein
VNQPTIVSHGELTSLTNIIRDARALSIKIPAEVYAELRVYRSIEANNRDAQREQDEAISGLYQVPASDFDAALDDAAGTVSRLTVKRELSPTLVAVAAHRLGRVVSIASAGFEAAVVDQFNKIAEDFQLAEHASNLPDLAQTGFNVMSVSGAAGSAIEAWRAALPDLGQRWHLYRNLAELEGQLLGPAGADDLATNLYTAAVLGTPGSWNQALAAAECMAAMSAGADSERPWAPLGLFALPSRYGYELSLSTSGEATRIRRAIQP